MIKTIFSITIFAFLALSFAAPNASAQKTKRIVIKKGYAVVSGTIKGDQTLEYVFRAKKNADIDMSVDNDKFANSIYPTFFLLKPNGKPFCDKDSVNNGAGTDMMDTLVQAGDYTIRLQLPEDMRNGGKPVKFTLRIK